MNPRGSLWNVLKAAAAFALPVAAILIALLLAFAPAPAVAQDPAPAQQEQEAAAEEPEETVTEEITVTSRLREETIQEVPISVAAPTEEVLRARGIENIEGVAQTIVGFTVQNLGQGQSQVAMRGVSAGQIVRDQPGVKEQVGMYLDDSVISLSLFTPDIDLFDLSRVEVLRGPQGTLFGSGSLSGTVRYITNQPELNTSDSVAELNFSSIEDGDIGGSVKTAVNVPMGDTAAMRFVGYYTSFGGFIDAVQPGLSVNEDYNSGERYGGRLAFKFQPNDRFTITPRLNYQKLSSDGRNQADIWNVLGNPYTTTRPAVDLGEREQFNQFDEPFDDDFLLADLNIGYDFGSVNLTSITSYTDRDIEAVRDATALTASVTGGSIGVPPNVYNIDAPLIDTTDVKVLTQEVRLSGGSDTFTWLGGVFYSTIDRDYGQFLPVQNFTELSGIPTAGFIAPHNVLYYSTVDYVFDQLALFGEATWAITDTFDLTGGLRYYDFEEDKHLIFDGIFAVPTDVAGSTTADGFAPRLIASLGVSESTTLNAQVSKGFRLGGLNDPLNVPLCGPGDVEAYGGHPTWDDEELWNYEVGTKSTIMDGRGTLNASAYYMDIDNLQATLTAGDCSSRVIINVPKARSMGLELEFAAAPSHHFDYSIALSYNDAELRSTFSSPSGDLGIRDGNRLPTVPEFQAVVAATYQWQMQANWLGYTTGTYQYVGSRFTQIGDQADGFGTVNVRRDGIGAPYTGSPILTFDPELPAYNIVNLRVGFLNDTWDLAFFVNNVTDEVARLSLDIERGSRARVGYLTNQPRTYGLSARINF